jgi:hypothetical protein
MERVIKEKAVIERHPNSMNRQDVFSLRKLRRIFSTP